MSISTDVLKKWILYILLFITILVGIVFVFFNSAQNTSSKIITQLSDIFSFFGG